MNQAVRAITENITSRLPQECAVLLERVLLEVYDIQAPRICLHFNLNTKLDGTTKMSLAYAKLLRWLSKCGLRLEIHTSSLLTKGRLA
jgi:hypothetical protein